MSQDRELDTYLQGKTDLAQAYADLPQVELPDHLDAAILAEAHRAVNSRPFAKPRRRWSIPLSMVASLIVAVIVGLQLPYMLKDADVAQLQPEERTVGAAADEKLAEPASPAPEERAAVQMAQPEPENTRTEPAPMADKAEVRSEANAPMLAAPKESRAAGANPPSAAPTAAPSPVAVPLQAPAAKRMELLERTDADNGVAQSKEKKTSDYTEGGVSNSLEQRAPAAAGMTAPQPAQPGRSLAQPLKEEASEASPEGWLLRIQRLKQQGKLDEARKELAAFKKRYPEYRVPEAFEVR